MRLIDTSTLRLVSRREGDVPAYAILSHTWGGDDEEVSFQDIQELSSKPFGQSRGLWGQRVTKKAGFAKIRDSALLAKSAGYQFIWIDTCCIDKTSSAELSEAINSMFRWYQGAAICYAFLNDVEGYSSQIYSINPSKSHVDSRSPIQVIKSIRESRWFTRGWTLQELVAPSNVYFYNQNWGLIGSKLGDVAEPLASFIGFQDLLAEITGIDLGVLTGSLILDDLSVAMKMKWAARRQTTRTEDVAYCLMGIFNVNMPLLYGEGPRAFMRLQEEILRVTDDQSIFAWKCPEDDMLRYQLSGLLASSPTYFEDFADIKPLPPDPTRASAPSTMTNAGLHVQLDLKRPKRIQAPAHKEYKDDVNEAVDDYYAILNCYPQQRGESQNSASYYLAIRLLAIGGDQHARLNAESVFWVPARERETRGIGEGERYVYVKQVTTYGLPDIVASTSDPESFTVVDGYPNWKPTLHTHTLKPEMSTRSSLGVFRYAINSSTILHTDHVDVFVGISPEQLGPLSWRCWCFIRPVETDSTGAMKALDEQTEPTGIRFHSRHVLGGIAASVETTRLRSRIYISLKLSEVYELHDLVTLNKALPVEPPGEIYELDSVEVATSVASITTLARTPVTEDSWEFSLGLTDGAIGQGGPKVRVWPRRDSQPGDPSSESLSLSDVFTQASKSQLSVEEAKNSEADVFEAFFSLLLVRACKKNDVAAATELLDSPLSVAHMEVRTSIKADQPEPWHSVLRGFRPLHWATALGHIDIIRLLIDRGADASSITHSGLSSIHLAAMLGHAEILNCLVDATRDAESQQFAMYHRVESPAHLAAACVMSPEVEGILYKLLFDNAAPGKDEQDQYAIPEDAFENGVEDHSNFEPNAGLAKGALAGFPLNRLRETPLHRAAAMNNTHATRCILSHCTAEALSSRDTSGRTPLWHAAAAGAIDSLRLLIASGASVNATDQIGRTPLHAACRLGHRQVVSELIASRASLNAVAYGPGFNACHFATIGDHADILQILLHKGADLEYCHSGDSRSVLPIHISAANGFLKCTRVLFNAKCDRDRKTNHRVLVHPSIPTGVVVMRAFDSTPVELALMGVHTAVVSYLI